MRTEWFVSLLLVFTIIGCSATVDNKQNWFESGSKRSKEAELASKSSYYFLLGELALKNKDYDTALSYYRKSIEFDKGDTSVVRKRIIEIALRNGKLEEALVEIQKIGSSTDPELLKLKAGMLASQKKFDEAIVVYKQLQNLNSGLDDETNIFLASLYAQKGDYASAKTVVEQVLKTQPQSVFAKYYMAKILLGLNDQKNSEVYFKEVIKVVPIIEPAYLDLARLYVYQKRIPEAIEVLELLVKRNPGNKAARSLLGELLLGEERVTDAIKEFEALGKIQDDPTDTRIRIAALKLQQRDFEGAEFELRLVLSQDKENSTARYYLANAYAGQKRVDEAIKEIKKIKSSQTFFVESRMLAVFYLKQDRNYDQALELLEEVIKFKPNDNKMMLLKSNILKDAGEIDGAIEILEDLVKKKPTDDGYLFTLAVLHDENGDEAQAIEILKKCIEVNPNNANALNYLGYTMAEREEDLLGARNYIDKALIIEPENGYFLDSLGWVYFKQKDFKSAKLYIEKAVSIVPDDAVILEHLARVYLALQDNESAKRTLNKALEYASDSDDKEVESRLNELIRSMANE